MVEPKVHPDEPKSWCLLSLWAETSLRRYLRKNHSTAIRKMLFFPSRLHNFSILQEKREVWVFSEGAAGPCGFSSVLMLLFSVMTEMKIIYLSTQLQELFLERDDFWSQPVQSVCGHCSDGSRHQICLSHSEGFHKSSKRWDVLTALLKDVVQESNPPTSPGNRHRRKSPTGEKPQLALTLGSAVKATKNPSKPSLLGQTFPFWLAECGIYVGTAACLISNRGFQQRGCGSPADSEARKQILKSPDSDRFLLKIIMF